MSTRVRFAPSPTGFLHIGSLRTVLFNYLIVKALEGTFILRIEDTDQKREVAGAAEHLVEILAWLDIHFDESPLSGGPFGPYVQSQRRDIYDRYAAEILESGHAYRCFCSSEEIAAMKEEQMANKLPPRYDRRCRNLSSEEVEARVARGDAFTIRQAMPLEGEVTAFDELRGDITFKAENLEDHVLIKTDGMPTYQFANVVDDHLMEISHVVRGDEWLSSFPKNVLLYRNFGWEPPKFVHIPLVLNKEGGKLSKRHGDVAVEDYRTKGYLPEALLNFCALLGWHSKSDTEIMPLDQIISEFKIKDIGTSPAIFDTEKLDYINGHYIRQKTVHELVDLVLPYLVEGKLLDVQDGQWLNNLTGEKVSRQQLELFVGLAHDRLKKLSEINDLTDYLFQPKLKYEGSLLVWKKSDAETTKKNLEAAADVLERIPETEWTRFTIEEALMNHIRSAMITVGEVLWPARVAMTGRDKSPGPFEVAEALGKEKAIDRIRAGAVKLK
ncbi:glutamate--tRNA ligase [Candidatus Falkowbacteria bacterium]|nr:glutamate--tRNA ligase [Candidatus Falkowbacteria bacterium]